MSTRLQAVISCYGEWRCDDGVYTYVGQRSIVRKGFVIRLGISYDRLIQEIMERFDLGCYPNEVVLHHRMYGNNLYPPCGILDDRDVSDVFESYEGVVPIYVTVHHSMRSHDNSGNTGVADVGQSSQSRVDLQLDNVANDYSSMEMSPVHLATPPPSLPTTEVQLYNDVTQDPEGTEDPEMPSGDEFDPTKDTEVEDEESEDGDPEPPSYVLPSGSVVPSNTRRDGTKLEIGDIFATRMDFDEVVLDDALKTGDVYRSTRCNKISRQWKCIVQNCPWAARAAKRGNGDLWFVTSYDPHHTCDLTGKSGKHRNCTSEYIAWRMRDQFANVVNAPGTQKIWDWCNTELKQDVSKYKAWDAHRKGVWFICGDADESYGNIPAFLHLVEVNNPGSITAWEVDGSYRFLYCFVALSASIVAWSYMRRVVVIDAAFLKTKFKGQMVAAHAVDSEGHIVPLACGVIDVECNSGWGWFLTQLKRFESDADDLLIVSDRHNSIKNAVKAVYPNAVHAHCYYHLHMNLMGIYGKTRWEKLFHKSAYTCSLKKHKEMLRGIQQDRPHPSAKNKMTMHEYLTKEVGVRKWARVHCPVPRYEIMTTNHAESFNSAMKRARYVLPINLLSYYIDKVIEWWENRRKEGDTFINILFTQRITDIINKNFKKSWSLQKPVPLGNDEYHIPSVKHGSCIVNTTLMTCTCGKWQILKIPCQHAMKVLETWNRIHQATSNLYSVECFRLVYQEETYSIPSPLEWDRESMPEDVKSAVCLPPAYIVKRGRQRDRRFQSKGEIIQKKKRNYGCSFCHKSGHYKRDCPNLKQ